MIESTYSTSSLVGLVSSNRRWQTPPFWAVRPKFRQMDLAWPMCRYPFGSGGKRVTTRWSNRPVARSSATIFWMKFAEGADSLVMSGMIRGRSTPGNHPRLPVLRQFASQYFVARSPGMLNVQEVRLASMAPQAPRLARDLPQHQTDALPPGQ